MFGSETDVEKNHQKIALAIEKLELEIEAINRKTDELYQELNVKPEQMKCFLETEKAFTEENWVELQTLQKTLEDKLERDLANIRNPNKTKQNRASLNVRQHWLFVR